MSDNWTIRLPHLYSLIHEGIVNRYDSIGLTKKLTVKQKNEIKRIENMNKSSKVVAVLDAKYNFIEATTMHFNTFLIISDEDEPEVIDDEKGIVDFFAYVKNLSDSSLSEYGYVGVKEISGRLKRIY